MKYEQALLPLCYPESKHEWRYSTFSSYWARIKGRRTFVNNVYVYLRDRKYYDYRRSLTELWRTNVSTVYEQPLLPCRKWLPTTPTLADKALMIYKEGPRQVIFLFIRSRYLERITEMIDET